MQGAQAWALLTIFGLHSILLICLILGSDGLLDGTFFPKQAIFILCSQSSAISQGQLYLGFRTRQVQYCGVNLKCPYIYTGCLVSSWWCSLGMFRKL